MTGPELKAMTEKTTEREAWREIIYSLTATGLSTKQVYEVMRKVAVWGAAVHQEALDFSLTTLQRLHKGTNS